MRIDNPSAEELQFCFGVLQTRVQSKNARVFVKYLDLGTHTIRLICHSEAFVPHIEHQLTFSLRDKAPSYDSTLVVWQDDPVEVGLSFLQRYNPVAYRRARVAKIQGDCSSVPRMMFCDAEVLRYWPLIDVNVHQGVLSAWDYSNSTYYYAVKDLDLEEIIKHGHLFVRPLSILTKGPSTNLVHGAAVGLEEKGVFFCGMGYRGKSTLSVASMLDGFDYVSDDYLMLGKEDGKLRSWPIYSIIALSPAMYQKIGPNLNGTFVSNNARKDKYVFNISKHHDQFRSGYPIKLCMYPSITDRPEPRIEPGSRDIALDEFVTSSLRIIGDDKSVSDIVRAYSLIADLPFYRFDLSPDLQKNTQCLRDFLEKY